jgi:hypothetical protein
MSERSNMTLNWNVVATTMIGFGLAGGVVAYIVRRDPLKGAAIGVFIGLVCGFVLATQ